MQAELFSYNNHYPVAIKGYYQGSYAFKSQYTGSPAKFISDFYRRALKAINQPFINQPIVSLAIQRYYQSNSTKSQPYNITKTAVDIANQYNMAVASRIKAGFKIPDFSELTDMIEFFGGILKNIIKVGTVGGVVLGIFTIIGAIVGAPTYAIVGVPSAATIVAMKVAEVAMAMQIASGVSLALSSLIGGGGTVIVSKAMWSLFKKLLEAFGILEKNRIINGLVGNTETYKKFEEAIELIDQYKYNQRIPKKVSHKIHILLMEAGAETSDFLKDINRLKQIHKKAAQTIMKQQKEKGM